MAKLGAFDQALVLAELELRAQSTPLLVVLMAGVTGWLQQVVDAESRRAEDVGVCCGDTADVVVGVAVGAVVVIGAVGARTELVTFGAATVVVGI